MEHKAREREVEFTRRLSDFGRALTLRGSTRFHHPDRALVDAFFARTPHEPVKAFLAVPIRLGATLTQGDLDEEGEAFYTHPSAVRHQERIDTDDCLRITQKFYDQQKRRDALRPGDVIINRSGEAAGKVALFESEEPCLFSDFTMRVRLSARMNPVFAWYYFRSVMFQQQVEREKRGMSLPNIFPPQVEGLYVPAGPREQQDELAEELNRAMAALHRERDAIEAGRNEINVLIEAALTAG